MITVYINDKPCMIEATNTLNYLLKSQQVLAKHCAVALNNKLVLPALYDSIKLNQGDKIDLMTPMQGG